MVERSDRRAARNIILQAANDFRKDKATARGFQETVQPLRMRHLERAVCIARRQQLVSAAILRNAGFRERGRR